MLKATYIRSNIKNSLILLKPLTRHCYPWYILYLSMLASHKWPFLDLFVARCVLPTYVSFQKQFTPILLTLQQSFHPKTFLSPGAEIFKTIEGLVQKWRIKINPVKSRYINFKLRRIKLPPVHFNGISLPLVEHVHYFRI